ncbi:MAG: DNA polymerase I [Verrucomicrobia bacterium]|nr:DNA polymerase I [Verrucomicrobiota bacterium]
MKQLYLIDVSGWIFRSYFALPPMSDERGEATSALYGFVRSLLKLLSDFHPTHLAAVFDGPSASKTRKAIHADYKAHRKATPPDLPHQIAWAKEVCTLLGITVVEVPDSEADDAIGTLAEQAGKKGVDTYICSSDKDFAQLVGPHISLLNTHKDNLLIGPKQVEEIWGVRPDQIIDLLAMMGDTSDNIPGLPGFGPKTAAKLLQEFGTLEEILKHPEKVAGKAKQQTLIEHQETAKMAQKLATIHLHLPLDLDEEALRIKEPNTAALEAFYRDKNFKSLLRTSLVENKKKSCEENYKIIDDEESFAHLLLRLKGAQEVCFDTETTGLRPLEAQLVGISFCLQAGEAFYVPCNGQLGITRVLQALKPLFEGGEIGFFGHNVKYDLHLLANYGIKLGKISFDTIIASYILNSHHRQHSLDHLALHHFEKVKIPIEQLIGSGKKQITMDQVAIEKVGEYACEDADYTFRLKELLAPQLASRGLEKVYYDIELPLLPILAKMERAGIGIDLSQLTTLSTFLNKALAQLEEEIFALAGESFTLNSPKQLSEILFGKMGIKPPKKTTTGYSTAADVLEELQFEHPICEKVLHYRQLEKLRSTYVESLPRQVNPTTGRIHCTFVQWVAATGRLSCVDPNLQNIPIRSVEGKKIREAFIPKQGCLFLAADYSQIELRLLAHLSGDRHLCEAFKQGEDIHAFTASQIFGIPVKEVTQEMRNAAKTVNFGIIYGQSAYGLSRLLKISAAEASTFIHTYFKRFDKVESFLEECKERARTTGRAVTLTGRERLIPEITSRNALQRQAAERLAVNTPLQGSSADLTKLAMISIDKKLTSGDMLLQIHDELIFEVPEGAIEQVKKMVKEEMEGVISLKVPLIVDLAIGKNWKEC